MLPRNYNYREHQINRVVKKRVLLNHFYKYGYERFHIGLYGFHTHVPKYIDNISFRSPEDKWFNYIGEYKEYYKERTNYRGYRRYHDHEWKLKYGKVRAKLKRATNKQIYDEVGEKYYISY